MTLGQQGAGEKEYDQILTIARAAQATPSLEHFVLHTLAAGEKLAGKEYVCPHWDYKDRAADEIKRSMPELASKTTFLWVGYFVSNLFTLTKPYEVVSLSDRQLGAIRDHRLTNTILAWKLRVLRIDGAWQTGNGHVGDGR